MEKKLKKFDVFKILIFVILALQCLSILFLLYWAIVTSLKSAENFRTNLAGLPAGMPWKWRWSNYATIFKKFYVRVTRDGVPMQIGMGYQITYTLIYCVSGALVSTLVPCFVAYCVAKFKFRFSRFIEGIVLITMVLPVVGNAASTLQFLDFFGLYDNIWLNVVTQFNFLGIYFLIYAATFRGVSDDYREAAYLDGANEYSVFFRIMLPLVGKILLTVFLLKFISYWEDYQTPLLYVPNYPTLAYGIYYLSNSSQGEINNVPMRMAGALIMAIPIIILYISFKERLMGNLSMGGVKE